MAGSAIGKQPPLRFLDAILGFAASAVELIVERGGIAG